MPKLLWSTGWGCRPWSLLRRRAAETAESHPNFLPMPTYRLAKSFGPPKNPCGYVGGTPRFPDGTDWPACRICGAELVAYLDIALPAAGADPFLPGSVLQVFACREHDGIPGTPYSGSGPFTAASRSERLPDGYWDLSDGHYLLRLLRPEAPVRPAASRDERLEPMFLSARPIQQAAAGGLKLLGVPAWIQNAEPHTCSCGAPMALVLQVPEDYQFLIDFKTLPPGTRFNPALQNLRLFLGNGLFLLACTRQCDWRALWPVVQN